MDRDAERPHMRDDPPRARKAASDVSTCNHAPAGRRSSACSSSAIRARPGRATAISARSRSSGSTGTPSSARSARCSAEATEDFREAKLTPDEFRRFFAPRLQFFLQGLEGHHQIEDFQYFPIFRRAEPRLAKGFDVLEGDHEAIHADILRVVDAANELLGTIEGDADRRRAATDAYADTSETPAQGPLRHLDDEEDLIVPVILDQGERKLFYG